MLNSYFLTKVTKNNTLCYSETPILALIRETKVLSSTGAHTAYINDGFEGCKCIYYQIIVVIGKLLLCDNEHTLSLTIEGSKPSTANED